MTSTGLPGYHDNIPEREPTQWNMDFLTPEQAAQRWSVDNRPDSGRITSVEGNTVRFFKSCFALSQAVILQFLFNDPPQCTSLPLSLI